MCVVCALLCAVVWLVVLRGSCCVVACVFSLCVCVFCLLYGLLLCLILRVGVCGVFRVFARFVCAVSCDVVWFVMCVPNVVVCFIA